MSKCVLDASAVLAYLHREPGRDVVARVLGDAWISAVNVAEVATRLADRGGPGSWIEEAIRGLQVEVIEFDENLSYRVATLRHATRHAGLSLGDRACLATAQSLGVRAVTADRNWSGLRVGIEIQVIR